MLKIVSKPKKQTADITLTRGDSAYIDISVKNSDDTTYALQDGDKIHIQVRDALNTSSSNSLLFEYTINYGDESYWHIIPANTADCAVGEYNWDAQIEFANGDIFTFIVPSIFEITDEVTIATGLSTSVATASGSFNRGEITGSIAETALKGDSAYDIAVKNGFEGTEEEWLESLHGSGSGTTTLPATTTRLGGIKVGSNLSVASDGTLSVVTTNEAEQDNTKPITSAGVYEVVGNIEAILQTI